MAPYSKEETSCPRSCSCSSVMAIPSGTTTPCGFASKINHRLQLQYSTVVWIRTLIVVCSLCFLSQLMYTFLSANIIALTVSEWPYSLPPTCRRCGVWWRVAVIVSSILRLRIPWRGRIRIKFGHCIQTAVACWCLSGKNENRFIRWFRCL